MAVDRMRFLVPYPLNVLFSQWRQLVPIWEKCAGCESFHCNRHDLHIEDCMCPPIEQWALSPHLH